MKPTPRTINNCELDPKIFLGTSGKGRKAVTFLKGQTIFLQGTRASTVFYIQEGKVRRTVVSRFGKEASLGILNEGEFFGDGGLAGQPLRMDSATAITGCKLLQIGKKEMMLALHRGHAFSELFVARLLARNIRYHESLVGKIFDSGEIRLARVLLLLAHFGKEDAPADVIPELSQEALASMSYTTSAHAGQIMNNFYKAGFLTYRKGKIQIDRTLLNVVLCDSSSRLTLTSKSPRA